MMSLCKAIAQSCQKRLSLLGHPILPGRVIVGALGGVCVSQKVCSRDVEKYGECIGAMENPVKDSMGTILRHSLVRVNFLDP